MAYRDEVDTPLIGVVGAFVAVIVFAIIVGLQVLHNEAGSSLRKRIDDIPSRELSDLVARQRARLVEYSYDPDNETYTIPIRQAMRKTVAELSAGASRRDKEANNDQAVD